jgi:hypothetical protein
MSFIHIKNHSEAIPLKAAQDARNKGGNYHELAAARLPLVTAPVELTQLLMAMGS